MGGVNEPRVGYSSDRRGKGFWAEVRFGMLDAPGVGEQLIDVALEESGADLFQEIADVGPRLDGEQHGRRDHGSALQ